MNSLVELIENKRENVTTRILKINDISLDYYKILFTPKLENTDFKYFDNQVFIELKNENFREQYDLWIISLYSKLKKQSNLEELILMLHTATAGPQPLSWCQARTQSLTHPRQPLPRAPPTSRNTSAPAGPSMSRPMLAVPANIPTATRPATPSSTAAPTCTIQATSCPRR